MSLCLRYKEKRSLKQSRIRLLGLIYVSGVYASTPHLKLPQWVFSYTVYVCVWLSREPLAPAAFFSIQWDAPEPHSLNQSKARDSAQVLYLRWHPRGTNYFFFMYRHTIMKLKNTSPLIDLLCVYLLIPIPLCI